MHLRSSKSQHAVFYNILNIVSEIIVHLSHRKNNSNICSVIMLIVIKQIKMFFKILNILYKIQHYLLNPLKAFILFKITVCCSQNNKYYVFKSYIKLLLIFILWSSHLSFKKSKYCSKSLIFYIKYVVIC